MSDENRVMPATAADAGQERDPAEDRPNMVYRELRELIVSGRLAPGTRLVETIVAERLGVSRTPVRSAFNRLQREGYAIAGNEGDERRRLVVAPITVDDAADLFHVVGTLEGLAGHYAASDKPERRTQLANELDDLNRELALESQRRPPDAYRAFRLDSSFHRQYVAASAPPRLLALHDVIKPQAERYARLYVTALTDELVVSVAEHEVIAAAIRSGDAAGAQQSIETNWRNAARRIASVISEWGESGGW